MPLRESRLGLQTDAAPRLAEPDSRPIVVRIMRHSLIASWNNVKTALLLGGLFALFVAVGSLWGRDGMLFAAILGVLTNLGAWWFSDRIAVAAMQGQEVDETSAPQLVRMVRELADRAQLPMPRVFICPHDAPNAFATGRSPRRAAVAVTQGALRLLDDRELRGVMAHELAHVRNRDTLISSVAATIAGVFSTVAQWAFLFGGSRDREGGHPLAGLLVILLSAVAAALLKAMISRSREFVADADGAAIAGSPDGLISALQRLDAAAARIPMHNPHPNMNNMFIVEPFVGETLTRMFASHPPTEARVRALRAGAVA
jgi:heat shock protein HtpX